MDAEEAGIWRGDDLAGGDSPGHDYVVRTLMGIG